MSTAIKNSAKTIEILYVENNASDAALMKEIFKTSLFPVRLNLVPTGEKALELLKEASGFPLKAKPDLILLDLSLPGISGLEVLAEIKSSKDIRQIPVLVMGVSRYDHRLQAAYDSHANFFIVKPMDTEQFAVVMTYIEKFWLARIH